MSSLLGSGDMEQKKLVYLISSVFVLFLILGLAFGYFWSNTQLEPSEPTQQNQAPIEESMQGRIVYVDPRLYPDENISYLLTDSKGKTQILLKSEDEKLVVAEGLWATVYGIRSKTMDNQKEVLIVDRVVLKQKE